MINIIGLTAAIAAIVFNSIYILLVQELNKKVVAATVFIFVAAFLISYNLNEMIVDAHG